MKHYGTTMSPGEAQWFFFAEGGGARSEAIQQNLSNVRGDVVWNTATTRRGHRTVGQDGKDDDEQHIFYGGG